MNLLEAQLADWKTPLAERELQLIAECYRLTGFVMLYSAKDDEPTIISSPRCREGSGYVRGNPYEFAEGGFSGSGFDDSWGRGY